MENNVLVEVRNLKKYFPIKSGVLSRTKNYLKAVDGVDLKIYKGETIGIVGESGCGKSTTGRLILKLLEATEGEIYFDGKEITSLNKNELKNMRKDFQMVFQDPYACLNPRLSIKSIIEEPLKTHKYSSAERKKTVEELLDKVGIPKSYMDRYPHEFSGGQRQRIGIARALALNPKFIVADEPVAALDVSIQAQILNLMSDLQDEFNLTYLFIAHDLSVVQYISDRIGVMYLGSMVELSESQELFDYTIHPYTRALLSAIPIPDPEINKRQIDLEGEIPSPINPPEGCRFHTRCPYVEDICKKERPEFREVKKEHYVACHLAERFIEEQK
ncbi:MAG: dipeptide ABC transporter ATP-binding protein [Eubacteriales bacterium]